MDERERVISHILTIDRRLYEYLQFTHIPDWAGVELTMPQLKVLFLTGGPRPMPASQIARSLGMTPSTATGVVDRLVAQGLVRRLEDPSDRRVVLLAATPEGSALLERLLLAGLGHFRDILDRLPLDDLYVVARALDVLHRAALSLSDGERARDDQPAPREAALSALSSSRPPDRPFGPPSPASPSTEGGQATTP
jgi:DNA-binding MarR family transcriptional regulator